MTWYGQDKKFGSTSDDPLDKILYERYFVGKRDGFFIEAGTGDGVFLSTCKAFEESFGWHGINVEPCLELFKELVKNRPMSTNVNFALSDRAGTAEFQYIKNSPGFSRIKDSALDWIDKTFKLEVGSTYTVATWTYKSLLKSLLNLALGIDHVDLFVLDAENHERQVIEGMSGSVMPSVMCVEHTQVGLDNLKGLLPGYRLDWNDGLNAAFVKVV